MARSTRQMIANRKLRQGRKRKLRADPPVVRVSDSRQMERPEDKNMKSAQENPEVTKIKLGQLHRGHYPDVDKKDGSGSEVDRGRVSAVDIKSNEPSQTRIKTGEEVDCDSDCDTKSTSYVVDDGGLRCGRCKSRQVGPAEDPDWWQCRHCRSMLVPRKYDPDERIAGYEPYGPYSWML